MQATWREKGLPAGGVISAKWLVDKLPYDVEHALLYANDLQPKDLKGGSRWQIRPEWGALPRQ